MLSSRLRDKRISSLFILRFVCVFLIVAIHYPMAHTDWLEPLLRISVPLFYMTSGYFLFSERRISSHKRISNSLKKMVWLILYANITFGGLKMLAHMAGMGDTPDFGSWGSWFKLIFVGNVVVEYLWYLTAYIEALLVFLVFFLFHRERFLIRLTPLFLLVGLLLGKYSFLLGFDESPALYFNRNFLTIALPCISIGYTLHRHEQNLLARLSPRLGCFAIILWVATMAEGFILRHSFGHMGDLYLTSVPFAITIFLFCLLHKEFGANTPFDRMGETHALNIYLFQALIAGLLIGGIQRLCGVNIAPYAAPLIFVGCLAFSEIINQTHHLLRR